MREGSSGWFLLAEGEVETSGHDDDAVGGDGHTVLGRFGGRRLGLCCLIEDMVSDALPCASQGTAPPSLSSACRSPILS